MTTTPTTATTTPTGQRQLLHYMHNNDKAKNHKALCFSTILGAKAHNNASAKGAKTKEKPK